MEAAVVRSKGLKRTRSISSLVVLQALPGGGESFVKQIVKIAGNSRHGLADGEQCPAWSPESRVY
jgi:hypothetical protein